MEPLSSVIIEIEGSNLKVTNKSEDVNEELIQQVNKIIQSTLQPESVSDKIVGMLNISDRYIVIYANLSEERIRVRYVVLNYETYKKFDFNPYILIDSVGEKINSNDVSLEISDLKEKIPNEDLEAAFKYPGGKDTIIFLMEHAMKSKDPEYIIGKEKAPANTLFKAICHLMPISERNNFAFISYANKPIKNYFKYLYTSKETFVNFDIELAKGLKTITLDDFSIKAPSGAKTKYGKFLAALLERNMDDAVKFMYDINGIIRARTASYKILKNIPDNYVDYIRGINTLKAANSPDEAISRLKGFKSIYLDSSRIIDLINRAWKYFEDAQKNEDLKIQNVANTLSDVLRKHISNLKTVAAQEGTNENVTKYITEEIIPKLEVLVPINAKASLGLFSTIYEEYISDKSFGLSKPILDIALFVINTFKSSDESIVVKLNQMMLQILNQEDIIRYTLETSNYLSIPKLLMDDTVFLMNSLLSIEKKVQLEVNLGHFSEIITKHLKNGNIDDSVVRNITMKIIDIIVSWTAKRLQEDKPVFELFDPTFDLIIAYNFSDQMTVNEKISFGIFGCKVSIIEQHIQAFEKYVKFSVDAENIEIDNIHKSSSFRQLLNILDEITELRTIFKRAKEITNTKFEFEKKVSPEFINEQGLNLFKYIYKLYEKSEECRYQILYRFEKLLPHIHSDNIDDIKEIVIMTHNEAIKLKNNNLDDRAISLFNIALSGLSKIEEYTAYIEIANELIPIISSPNVLSQYAFQFIDLYEKLTAETLVKYHDLIKSIVYRIYPSKKDLALSIMLKELNILKILNPDLYFETINYNITLSVSDNKIVAKLFNELLSSRDIDANRFITLTAETMIKAYKNNKEILDSIIEATLFSLITHNEFDDALKILDIVFSKIQDAFKDFAREYLKILLRVPINTLLMFIDRVFAANVSEATIISIALQKNAIDSNNMVYALPITQKIGLSIIPEAYTEYIQNVNEIINNFTRVDCEDYIKFENDLKSIYDTILIREDNALNAGMFKELLNMSMKLFEKISHCKETTLKLTQTDFARVLIDISQKLNLFGETTIEIIKKLYEISEYENALVCWKYTMEFVISLGDKNTITSLYDTILEYPELIQKMTSEDFIRYIPIAVDVNHRDALITLITSKYISNVVEDPEEFITDLSSLDSLIKDIRSLPIEQQKNLIQYIIKFSNILPNIINHVLKSKDPSDEIYVRVSTAVGAFLAISISNEYYDTSEIIEEQIKFWFSTNNADAVVAFLESIMNNLNEKYRASLLNSFFEKVEAVEINATTARVYAEVLRALTKYMKKNGEKIMKQSAKILASVPAGPGLIIPFIVPKSKDEEPPIKTKSPEDLTKLVLDITSYILKSTKVTPKTKEEQEIYVTMGENLDRLTKYFRERAGLTDWLIKDEKEAKKLKKYKGFFDKTLDILKIIFDTYPKLSQDLQEKIYPHMRDITESQLYYWSAIGELKIRRYLCQKINVLFSNEPELKMSCFGF